MRRILRLLAAVLGLVVAGGIVADLYARYPADFPVPALAPPADTRVLVLLLHGSGGREEPSLIALEQRFRELAAARGDVAVMRYVWSPHSDTRLRARVNGWRVGDALGREVAALPTISVVHLVGHSAGAYPVQAFCEGYRAAGGGRGRILSTFLDPIGFNGALNSGWGAQELGSCADYAEAYINTDDPVPATNAPLEQAWNVDVTALRPATADGHRWPVEYYLGRLSYTDVEGVPYQHAGRARGRIVRPSR
jgi:hypothetical protein